MKKALFFRYVLVLLFPAIILFAEEPPVPNDRNEGLSGSFDGVISGKSGGIAQITSKNGNICRLVFRDASYSLNEDVMKKLKYANEGKESVKFFWFIKNKRVFLQNILPASKEQKIPEVFGGQKYEDDKKEKDVQSVSLYAKAIKEHSNGYYEEALKICQAILVLNPKYAPAQKLTLDLNKKIKQKEAKGHLQEALILAEDGKLLEASGEWQLALSTSPEDEDIAKEIKDIKDGIIRKQNRKATELFNSERIIDAVSAWNVVLAIEKDDPVAKKGLTQANKKLKNISVNERKKMEYEALVTSAKKEYEEKSYLAAIQYYKQALTQAKGLGNMEKDINYISREIKRISEELESKKKINIDNASRYADARNWVEMSKELRDCQKIDPDNTQAKELLEKYQSEVRELRDRLYLEGLEAYGKEDLDAAIKKWSEVLFLDPTFEKADLNKKKAERKK